VNDREGRAAGGQGDRGLSPQVGGSLARASSAVSAPARAAAANAVCPGHRPRPAPTVTHHGARGL